MFIHDCVGCLYHQIHLYTLFQSYIYIYQLFHGYSFFFFFFIQKQQQTANSDGGEWFFRGYMPLADLDMYWEDTILSIIGETLDPSSNELCGVRIIDKSRVGR